MESSSDEEKEPEPPKNQPRRQPQSRPQRPANRAMNDHRGRTQAQTSHRNKHNNQNIAANDGTTGPKSGHLAELRSSSGSNEASKKHGKGRGKPVDRNEDRKVVEPSKPALNQVNLSTIMETKHNEEISNSVESQQQVKTTPTHTNNDMDSDDSSPKDYHPYPQHVSEEVKTGPKPAYEESKTDQNVIEEPQNTREVPSFTPRTNDDGTTITQTHTVRSSIAPDQSSEYQPSSVDGDEAAQLLHTEGKARYDYVNKRKITQVKSNKNKTNAQPYKHTDQPNIQSMEIFNQMNRNKSPDEISDEVNLKSKIDENSKTGQSHSENSDEDVKVSNNHDSEVDKELEVNDLDIKIEDSKSPE